MPRLSTLPPTGELRLLVQHSLKHRQHPPRLSNLSNACGCGAMHVATALCPWPPTGGRRWWRKCSSREGRRPTRRTSVTTRRCTSPPTGKFAFAQGRCLCVCMSVCLCACVSVCLCLCAGALCCSLIPHASAYSLTHSSSLRHCLVLCPALTSPVHLNARRVVATNDTWHISGSEHAYTHEAYTYEAYVPRRSMCEQIMQQLNNVHG